MNSTEPQELSMLAPTGPEIAISVSVIVHMVLMIVVVLRLVRGRLVVPPGAVDRLLAILIVLGVPVLGPLLVLLYGPRAARYEARRSADAASA